MRRLLRRTAIVVGALLTLVALRIVLGRLAGPMLLENARARFETELGPIRPELADQTIPAEDNAGLLLLEAVEALDLSDGDRDLLRRLGRDPSGAGLPELRERLRPVIERNLGPLLLIDRAAERSASLLKQRREYFLGEGGLVELSGLLNAASLIRAAGWIALGDGDDEALLVSVERLATLARALRQERILVAELASFPIEGFLHDLVRRRVVDPVPAGTITGLEDALRTVERAPGIRETLVAEFSVGDAVYPELRAAEGVEEPLWGRLLRPWDENHVEADGVLAYADLGALLDRPRVEWPEPAARPRADRFRIWLDPFSMPTIARDVMLPSLRDTIEKAHRAEAEHALARFALAQLSGEPLSDSLPITYTGEAIQSRTLEDGTLELALPAAAALVRAQAEAHPDPEDPLHGILWRQVERMTWRVAAPPEAPGTDAESPI